MAVEISSEEQLQSIIKAAQSKPTIFNFYATWAQPCKDMNDVFDELAAKYPALSFVKLEAENYPDFSEEQEIAAVPTFILFKDGKPMDRVEGANAPMLKSTVEKYGKASANATKFIPPQLAAVDGVAPLTGEALEKRLNELVNSHPVMLFMKGTPQQPRCGFSRQLVELLNSLETPYGSFNILADENIRNGLKEFSKWPTFPQLYVNGEFIGGLDVVKEMVDANELQAMLPKEEPLNDRLKKLINKAKVMLFMKGDPSQPKCGFSRQIVGILNEQDVAFESFDILTDDEVRAGLKEYSNWPTYPQLYVKGELMGGLDIVKEMVAGNEFKSAVA
ncbi:hypothetical protein SmJEL517_g02636 [Synchytrium microbalum]|uniref:Thioredoxin domain-containing protein n=1 Tax=Synchytrium microbalum TaxID=1806994 RepID=A0A507C6V7_9FUNG|nr:uncharacterized protein SmJEL517_g02636 [Synchytrium microbalum]TPX34859.1 hypothetical protein SmJEL517_g02636 [Synchytrium microbalum]